MFGWVNPRQQGDIGERAAAAWLLGKDAVVAYPFGHSPNWDVVAEIDAAIVDYGRRCAARSKIFAARGDARVVKGTAL